LEQTFLERGQVDVARCGYDLQTHVRMNAPIGKAASERTDVAQPSARTSARLRDIDRRPDGGVDRLHIADRRRTRHLRLYAANVDVDDLRVATIRIVREHLELGHTRLGRE